MKKAILASGLFSLVMVLSSFTTVEATSTVEVGGNEVQVSGQKAVESKKLEAVDLETISRKSHEVSGSGAVRNKFKSDF